MDWYVNPAIEYRTTEIIENTPFVPFYMMFFPFIEKKVIFSIIGNNSVLKVIILSLYNNTHL